MSRGCLGFVCSVGRFTDELSPCSGWLSSMSPDLARHPAARTARSSCVSFPDRVLPCISSLIHYFCFLRYTAFLLVGKALSPALTPSCYYSVYYCSFVIPFSDLKM